MRDKLGRGRFRLDKPCDFGEIFQLLQQFTERAVLPILRGEDDFGPTPKGGAAGALTRFRFSRGSFMRIPPLSIPLLKSLQPSVLIQLQKFREASKEPCFMGRSIHPVRMQMGKTAEHVSHCTEVVPDS